MSEGAKAKRKAIDWEAVEIQYRAGIRSLKDIGSEFGVSDAAIIKRARRDGWERDLKAKIQARAEAKVSASMVSAEVSAQTKIREKEVIEANAQAIVQVRLTHRSDIRRARTLAAKMIGELEITTDNLELFQSLGEMLRQEDDKGVDKLNDLYHKVIGMSGRISNLKALAETLKHLVTLEREAYGIKSGDQEPGMSDGPTLSEADRANRIANLLAKAAQARASEAQG